MIHYVALQGDVSHVTPNFAHLACHTPSDLRPMSSSESTGSSIILMTSVLMASSSGALVTSFGA